MRRIVKIAIITAVLGFLAINVIGMELAKKSFVIGYLEGCMDLSLYHYRNGISSKQQKEKDERICKHRADSIWLYR